MGTWYSLHYMRVSELIEVISAPFFLQLMPLAFPVSICLPSSLLPPFLFSPFSLALSLPLPPSLSPFIPLSLSLAVYLSLYLPMSLYLCPSFLLSILLHFLSILSPFPQYLNSFNSMEYSSLQPTIISFLPLFPSTHYPLINLSLSPSIPLPPNRPRSNHPSLPLPRGSDSR